MTLQEYTQQLLEYLRVEPISVEIEENDQYFFVQIEVGETDTGKMIGNHGETIRAFQQILSLSYKEELGEKRVVVNVNDYKQRREDRAREIGLEAAERAISEQRPQDLPPLQSFERRAIHEALKDYAGVFTQSEGEGRYRRLVVYPESYRDSSDDQGSDYEGGNESTGNAGDIEDPENTREEN
jgi:spoIIIJ-associated protein